jgi:hypothetical protein
MLSSYMFFVACCVDSEKRTRTSTPLRALEPESKYEHLGRLPKTTENHLKPAAGAGLSRLQTTE